MTSPGRRTAADRARRRDLADAAAGTAARHSLQGPRPEWKPVPAPSEADPGTDLDGADDGLSGAPSARAFPNPT
ncbi:hypothetical protein [Streptomyces sparsus]